MHNPGLSSTAVQSASSSQSAHSKSFSVTQAVLLLTDVAQKPQPHCNAGSTLHGSVPTVHWPQVPSLHTCPSGQHSSPHDWNRQTQANGMLIPPPQP